MKNSSFGKNLSELMKTRNLSGRKLAEDLMVPYRTVQEWIGPGSRMPRDSENIRKLAEYFQCSTHFLLFGVEDPRSLIGEILDKTEIHTGLYEITIRKVSARPIKKGGKE